MLDAAEHILKERGYGELTSRSVAEQVGVKQRLVYYYFHTMDDLIVETFRRLAVREIERFEFALASENSLREVWRVFADTADTKLVSEFMALANRNGPLREEVASHIKASRQLQVSAIEKALEASGKRSALAANAALIFASAAALAVHREAALGIDCGHAEVIAAIEEFIETHEPKN